MRHIIHLASAALCLLVTQACATAPRDVTILKDWTFQRGAANGAQAGDFDDSAWEAVTVPHDWAIKGPFDKEIDKQVVKIEQNMEKDATEKTGRTGALPYIGEGWYRTTFDLSNLEDDQRVLIQFDGAMSQPVVYVNGEEVGRWNYGYAYFYFDITNAVKKGDNTLAVHLTNVGLSSRWYPGAGIYRKVQVIVKNSKSFEQWGTVITTPKVTPSKADVQIAAKVSADKLQLKTAIIGPDEKPVAFQTSEKSNNGTFTQNITVQNPQLWSPESPTLYTAVTRLYDGDELVDEQRIRFGIRTLEYEAVKGFSLNGEVRKFKGVCLHHDLGPLGAAVNKAALRRQLVLMKEMGCDAIRSSHNMPSMEQLELCDELGLMFLAESFDEWARAKVKNGYNRFFREDAEKDIVNLVRATRNHPCIVMWSSGNEVPDQWGSEGVKLAKWLQDIFHREDPAGRPVTVGMDQVANVMKNGFGAVMDVPGLNYRTHLYDEAHEHFPQGFVLGSETASTVSSRGVYKFPVRKAKMKMYPDGQCSSYDLEYCSWSNLPEEDFMLQDDKPWVIGEFVWTGFDYLGEPTPYDTYWPSRSSYFGICDLAGLPKDRYYLYRSRWNTEDDTLHILPHWTWPGREDESTPVFVYTSYDSAELFVNGKSMGVQKKVKDRTPQHRYRLMWDDVKYEPGTLRVVAFDSKGNPAAEEKIKTAGEPHRIVLEADRTELSADGEDISFVTVSVVDKDGIPCPTAANQLNFTVTGAGSYRAACNGDATSLELFHEPTMKLFSGKLVVLVQASKTPGDIALTVSGETLKPATLNLKSELPD